MRSVWHLLFFILLSCSKESTPQERTGGDTSLDSKQTGQKQTTEAQKNSNLDGSLNEEPLPVGADRARLASKLMENWRKKKVEVILGAFGQASYSVKGYCFLFEDWADSQVYKITLENTYEPLLGGDNKTQCAITEHESLGDNCPDGLHKLEIVCNGVTLNQCFTGQIKGEESTFNSTEDPPSTYTVTTGLCQP